MRRTRGFTLIELLVVIAIIGILAALLLPALSSARCHSKHNAGQASIMDFSIALRSYEIDFGQYPPEEAGNYLTSAGAASLINVMSAPGPKNVPYYTFRSDQINAAGQWMTPLTSPYKYRENQSEVKPNPLPAVPDPLTMVNYTSFDMWACGCGDSPGCDMTTSDPPTAATIKNW